MRDLSGMVNGDNKPKRKLPRTNLDDVYENTYNTAMDNHEKYLSGLKDDDVDNVTSYAKILEDKRKKVLGLPPNHPDYSKAAGEGDAAFNALQMIEKRKKGKYTAAPASSGQ